MPEENGEEQETLIRADELQNSMGGCGGGGGGEGTSSGAEEVIGVGVDSDGVNGVMLLPSLLQSPPPLPWMLPLHCLALVLVTAALIIIMPVYLEAVNVAGDAYSALLFVSFFSSLPTILYIQIRYSYFCQLSRLGPPHPMRIVRLGGMHGLAMLLIVYALDRKRIVCHAQEPLMGLVVMYIIIIYFFYKGPELSSPKMFSLCGVLSGLFLAMDFQLNDKYRCRGGSSASLSNSRGPSIASAHSYGGDLGALSGGLGIYDRSSGAHSEGSGIYGGSGAHIAGLGAHIAGLGSHDQGSGPPEDKGEATWSLETHSLWTIVYAAALFLFTLSWLLLEREILTKKSVCGADRLIPTVSGRAGGSGGGTEEDREALVESGGSGGGVGVGNNGNGGDNNKWGVYLVWFTLASFVTIVLFLWTDFFTALGKAGSPRNFLHLTSRGWQCHFHYGGAECGPTVFYGWGTVVLYTVFLWLLGKVMGLSRSMVFTLATTSLALPLQALWWSVFRIGGPAGMTWKPQITGELVFSLLGLPVMVVCLGFWIHTDRRQSNTRSDSLILT